MVYFTYDRLKKDLDSLEAKTIFVSEAFEKTLSKLDTIEYRSFMSEVKRRGLKFQVVKRKRKK